MPSTPFSPTWPSGSTKRAPLYDRAAILLRPTERSTPDEWARKNRVYKPSAGIPGPRDPGLTPYLVPFARAFDVVAQLAEYGISYDALALACGSQMGKTDTVLDVIGCTLDQRPAPIMYVGPNKDFLHKEIEPRLTEMLIQAPRLKERLAVGKRNTKFRKIVGGVPVVLAWAGSNTSLRGMAAKIAIVDELDAMASSIQGNGDPFTLIEARGFSFRDRIRAAISTPLKGSVDVVRDEASGLEFWQPMPTEDIESPIWRLWQSGTRHHYVWPCPECADFFVPRFKQLRWNKWPELCSAAEAKRSAYIECPHCGGVIEESHKRDLNARAHFVAPGQTIGQDGKISGEPPETTTLSFWVSGLCSPMVTIGERAAQYVAAKLTGEQDKIQSAINTGFGECFAPGGGDVPEWEEVAALKRPYQKLEAPPGVRLLTLAVDVQKNRLYYTIRGWGANASSWLVDFGELFGPTTEQEVWDQLADLLHRPIAGMVIRKALIDSGFRPGKPINLPQNKVYAFCRRFPRLAIPTKGRATQDKPLILSKPDVKASGEVKKYGLDLLWLDTDHFKSWVHERIRWEPERPGAWLLPEDTTDDYCKQIVSEARVRKPSGAPEWIARSRNNHYLDCEALQAAAAHLLNVHLLRDETAARPASAPARVPRTQQRRQSTAVAAPSADPKSPAVATRGHVKPAKTEDRAARRQRIAEMAARLYGPR